LPTLVDIAAREVDVATIADESRLAKVRLQGPQQLYELWERQHWSAHSIDLSADIAHWQEFPEEMKSDILWLLSSFFVGEERVTTQFSGLVMSYADQSEQAFLASQQVDEARHTQFFARFYDEVFAVGGGIDAQLEQVRANLTDAFLDLFDNHLVNACDALAAEPSDLNAKVDFVTLYHMVIEGILALTGQNFITEYFLARGILPGFVEGFQRISQDEHRHVAYGTWFLKECASDPALARRIQAKLAELLPTAAAVLVPPGKDPFGEWSLLGYGSEEVNTFAFTALSRRLKVIGVALPDLAAA